MDWEVNQKVNKEGSYRELERDLKKYAEDKNNKVYLRVEPIYTDDSSRPSVFYYDYKVIDKVTGKENYIRKGYIENTTTPRPKKRSKRNGK